MTDKLIIDARVGEKNYKEIKANEVLSFLNRYSKIQWDKGRRRTRQLFPSFDIISKNCHINDSNTRIIIRYLESKGEIIRDVSQRYLKWVWQKLQEKEKKEKELKMEKLKEVKVKIGEVKPLQPISEKKIETNNIIKTTITIFDKIKLTILKVVMTIVAIIVMGMSVYFTYLWFIEMFENIKSFLLSVSIVATSITSFEMIILFKSDKKYLFAILFSLLWISVVSFSITTGLSGQLNSEISKQIKLDESNLIDNSKVLLYQDYQNRLDNLKIEIISLRKERDKLQEFISNSSFDTTDDKREYKNLNYRIYLKNNNIKELLKESKDLEKKKEELLKQNVKIDITKKIDFFDWLQSIFKISADKFRFILYLILAIFVDILCPINFSIVLFYKRKNNEY